MLKQLIKTREPKKKSESVGERRIFSNSLQEETVAAPETQHPTGSKRHEGWICVSVCVSERHHYFTWGHFYSNKHDLMSPKQARGATRTLVWWRLSLQRFTRRKKRNKLLFHRNPRENVQPFHSKSPTLELRHEPRLPLHLGRGLSLCNLWCHAVTLNRWWRWSQDTSKSHRNSAVREEKNLLETRATAKWRGNTLIWQPNYWKASKSKLLTWLGTESVSSLKGSPSRSGEKKEVMNYSKSGSTIIHSFNQPRLVVKVSHLEVTRSRTSTCLYKLSRVTLWFLGASSTEGKFKKKKEEKTTTYFYANVYVCTGCAASENGGAAD